MTDGRPDESADQEDEVLLIKLDSMLRRHRREHSSFMPPAEQTAANQPDSAHTVCAGYKSDDVSPEDTGSPSESDDIPVLTEQVTLSVDEWPARTEISELLYFAFDAALREAHISLNPADRLTLIQTLAKRLPGNF